VVSLYAGFDPTAASLHAGNLVPLLTLRRFQQAGARPIVLAGGATGMIGDPRDTGERTLQQRRHGPGLGRSASAGSWSVSSTFDGSGRPVPSSSTTSTGPAGRLRPSSSCATSASTSRSTSCWLARRSSAGSRPTASSYTEFSYLLLQSHDFLHLYREHGCRLQIGGSDQWGNIIGGVELVRRVEGGSAHALTTAARHGLGGSASSASPPAAATSGSTRR
jgi:tyrosyl-tRNA synthetase